MKNLTAVKRFDFIKNLSKLYLNFIYSVYYLDINKILNRNKKCMSLDQKDLELIERIIYKNGDDIAVSISRSFERLEERIDNIESRSFFRITEIDDKIENCQLEISDLINELKEELKEISRLREFKL